MDESLTQTELCQRHLILSVLLSEGCRWRFCRLAAKELAELICETLDGSEEVPRQTLCTELVMPPGEH